MSIQELCNLFGFRSETKGDPTAKINNRKMRRQRKKRK
jgi:hypothetical protein